MHYTRIPAPVLDLLALRNEAGILAKQYGGSGNVTDPGFDDGSVTLELPPQMPWGDESLPADRSGREPIIQDESSSSSSSSSSSYTNKSNSNREATEDGPELSEDYDSGADEPQPDEDNTFTIACENADVCGRYRRLEATLVYTQGWLHGAFVCSMVPNSHGGESSHEDPCAWCNDTGRAIRKLEHDCDCVPGLAALAMEEEEQKLVSNVRPLTVYQNIGQSTPTNPVDASVESSSSTQTSEKRPHVQSGPRKSRRKRKLKTIKSV